MWVGVSSPSVPIALSAAAAERAATPDERARARSPNDLSEKLGMMAGQGATRGTRGRARRPAARGSPDSTYRRPGRSDEEPRKRAWMRGPRGAVTDVHRSADVGAGRATAADPAPLALARPSTSALAHAYGAVVGAKRRRARPTRSILRPRTINIAPTPRGGRQVRGPYGEGHRTWRRGWPSGIEGTAGRARHADRQDNSWPKKPGGRAKGERPSGGREGNCTRYTCQPSEARGCAKAQGAGHAATNK